jgi:glyoxylase-like metal-dependent hydrolase (beta-lactamase superfamily II)
VKQGERRDGFYAVKRPRGTLTDVLAANGIAPEDVTDFIYTHLHFDHAGGATIPDGSGGAKPLFPNARHYVQAKHVAWGRNPSDKDRAGFAPENWEPVERAGLMQELNGETELAPGLRLVLSSGHTESMQLVQVTDGSEGFIFAVDLIPMSAHLKPAWLAALDNMPLLVVEEKKRLMKEVADKGWKMAFSHDPHTTIVTLSEKDGKYIPTVVE